MLKTPQFLLCFFPPLHSAMFLHRVPDTPYREQILQETTPPDFDTPFGHTMRCLTPAIFEDCIHCVIFSLFRKIYFPQDDYITRRRISLDQLLPSDVWVFTNLRQRALVAVYESDRWNDVIEHFHLCLNVLPFSDQTKIEIRMEFFEDGEPRLREVCDEMSKSPDFQSYVDTVLRQT